jgi:hypothetical protein
MFAPEPAKVLHCSRIQHIAFFQPAAPGSANTVSQFTELQHAMRIGMDAEQQAFSFRT